MREVRSDRGSRFVLCERSKRESGYPRYPQLPVRACRGFEAAGDDSKARVVVLSGAGMSAESGVPTFRGAGGLWREFRPEDLATPAAFARDPRTVSEWYEWRRQIIAGCQPNAGHRAIALLEQERPSTIVVTQNVDGLHQRAGSKQVLELHGSIWSVRCERGCGERLEDPATIADQDRELPPRCTRCGGLERPGVVWFGEALDRATIAHATEAVTGADIVLVVGTSALVYPAAGLPLLALESGARVIEINPEATPLSAFAHPAFESIRARAAEALPEIIADLLAKS